MRLTNVSGKVFTTVCRELNRNSDREQYSSSKKSIIVGVPALLSMPEMVDVVRKHFYTDLWLPEEIANCLAVKKYAVTISTTPIYCGIFENLVKSNGSSKAPTLGTIESPITIKPIKTNPVRTANNRLKIRHWKGDMNLCEIVKLVL